jgi:hypothetical protein
MAIKKLPKINRRRAAGSGSGYSWDLGVIAFGDVRDIIRRYEPKKEKKNERATGNRLQL